MERNRMLGANARFYTCKKTFKEEMQSNAANKDISFSENSVSTFIEGVYIPPRLSSFQPLLLSALEQNIQGAEVT